MSMSMDVDEYELVEERREEDEDTRGRLIYLLMVVCAQFFE